ncbi:hypothetical protein JB92DRAFT_3099961 [Gautieria morchelliformis]|nr:hypothetical protein JB92DRAFT_3099961 [Gautieria morchelliformis]
MWAHTLEYLPLFEFAFEKVRFPSREDKKHLAHISGMSFRQVSVWFQNHAADKPPAPNQTTPQDFQGEEERLGDSAREALSKPHPLAKKLNPDPMNTTTSAGWDGGRAHFGATPHGCRRTEASVCLVAEDCA